LYWIFRYGLTDPAIGRFTEETSIDEKDAEMLLLYPGHHSFNVLLGSPNGMSSARLLIDHRLALGRKNIKEIGLLVGRYPDMWLKLEDYQDSAPVGASPASPDPMDVDSSSDPDARDLDSDPDPDAMDVDPVIPT